MSTYLCIVLAADVDDYLDWCRAAGCTPLRGTAYALSGDTGTFVTRRRTFQVTDRWRENKKNRAIVQHLLYGDAIDAPVPYGDEAGPWPAEQIPDLSWPSWWQRLTRQNQ
ncbi:hypothetical protein [Streptomyces sp. SGAir0957]